jgi:hypothetical protein
MKIQMAINNDCGEFMMNDETLENYCTAMESALIEEFPGAEISVEPSNDFDRTEIIADDLSEEDSAQAAIERISSDLWANQESWYVEDSAE